MHNGRHSGGISKSPVCDGGDNLGKTVVCAISMAGSLSSSACVTWASTFSLMWQSLTQWLYFPQHLHWFFLDANPLEELAFFPSREEDAESSLFPRPHPCPRRACHSSCRYHHWNRFCRLFPLTSWIFSFAIHSSSQRSRRPWLSRMSDDFCCCSTTRSMPVTSSTEMVLMSSNVSMEIAT
jgi:hypothetical protein